MLLGPPCDTAVPVCFSAGTTKALVSFPGTEPLLHAVVVASNPASLALSGRYNSVLNDGLFSSLQVRLSLTSWVIPYQLGNLIRDAKLRYAAIVFVI